MSLGAWGRHLASQHPAHYDFSRSVRKTKRLAKAVAELNVAKQSKKFENRSLRQVPIERIRERDLKTIADWTRLGREGASMDKSRRQDPLLLTAVEMADDAFANQKKYEQAVRGLAHDIARGAKTASLTLTERKTFFDPRISLEVFKIMWATRRGWSFVIHLLLCYGINAFVESLYTEGLSPSNTIPEAPSPEDMVRQTARQAADALASGRDFFPRKG